MNSRSAAIVAAFAIVCNAPAQEASLLLKGMVLENTLSGKGVYRAAVSAKPPGNSLVTNPDGTFTLEFPRSRPGELVTITVRKVDPVTLEEYVVINDVQLKTFLPAIDKMTDANRIMTFVVCRKRDREEYARLFYKLKSLEAIEADSRRRLAPVIAEKERLQRELQASTGKQEELTAKIREQDDEIARLKRERVDLEDAAAVMSEQLAAGTAGENSDRYQEAMRLILDGDVEGALRVLDHAAIVRKAQDANKILAAGQAQLKQATDEFLLRAVVLMSRLRLTEAEAEYQAAIDAAPFSFDAHYRYGQMERVLHRHDKAIELLGKSRKIAELASDKPDLGLALTALGNTYADKKRFEDAAATHKIAREGYEALVKQDAAAYNPFLAGALINEGIAHRRLNHKDQANQLFTRALGIVTDSLDQAAVKTLELRAAVNGNLGNLRRIQARLQEAYDFYKSGISAWIKLVAIDASEYEPGLAQDENNLGMFADEASVLVANLRMRQQLNTEALQYLDSAREIRERLAARIPEMYKPDYAQTLTNLGKHYGGLRQYAKATESLEKAVSIRRELVEKSLDAYGFEYANSLYFLGRAYFEQYGSTRDPQLLGNAASTLETAVQVCANGAKNEPAGFALPLGRAQTLLADVFTTQARLEDAQRAFDQALAAYDKADSGQTAYTRFHTWSRIGYFRLKQGHEPEAIQAFEQAQSYFARFSPQEKQLYRSEVLDTAGTLAVLKATRQ